MSVLRWITLVTVIAVTAIATAAVLLTDSGPDVVSLILPLPYLASGLVVMAKRPWHVVGWLLMLVGLGLSLTTGPGPSSAIDPPWYPWMAWVFEGWGGYFGFLAVVALIVVFPDGLNVRSNGDRRLGWTLIGTMGGLVVLAALSSPVGGGDSPTGFAEYANPLGVELVPKAVVDGGYLAAFAVIVIAVVWMWVRQRAEHGVARRRYTLVLFSFALLIAALIFGVALSGTVGDWAWIFALLGWFWLPVAFAIAVLRHGLYGLDRIVSRTVTYGLVAAVVAVIYIVPVLTLPVVFGDNAVVVAVATLLAAMAFNPVRRRVQRAVDERFDRARYEADREVEAFAQRLRGQAELDVVLADLSDVVQRTLHPLATAVWIE
jgi:hypothetical protein